MHQDEGGEDGELSRASQDLQDGRVAGHDSGAVVEDGHDQGRTSDFCPRGVAVVQVLS